MKKLIATILALAMTASFAACGAEEPAPIEPIETDAPTTAVTEEVKTDDTEPSELDIDVFEDDGDEDGGMLAGGWTITSEAPEFTAPEEAQAAFDAAMEGFTGVGYTPVAFLGTQVVAGTNYAFLCTATTVTADPVTSLAVVTVYQDLEGNCEVLNVTDVDIATVLDEGSAATDVDGMMVGGWSYDEACGAGLDEDTQAAFDAACAELEGAVLAPLATMGTQVVAGVNTAILCTSTPVVPDATASLVVAVVYAGVDGTTQIINIVPFNF